jgi:hypothetical protein
MDKAMLSPAITTARQIRGNREGTDSLLILGNMVTP